MEGKIVGGIGVAFVGCSLAAGVYQGEISLTWVALAFIGLLGFIAGRATAKD